MAGPKLTEAVVRAGAVGKSFQRGLELYRRGAIEQAAIQGQVLTGDCEGTQAPSYKVRVELDGGGIRSATCTCPYDFGGYCKHIVALLLAYAHAPQEFTVRKDPTELLADLSRDQLVALLTKLMREQPDLYDRVEAAMALPAAPDKGRAKAAKRTKVDTAVYRRRVRNIMHSLDGMRASEAYWHVGSLAEELRGVQHTALEFLKAGDADAALQIMLTLVEESHDGFDYIDDSDGELGGFLSGTGEALAEVILSLDLNEEERQQLIKQLEELDGELSNYGVDGLKVAIAAATYGWDEAPREDHDQRDEVEDDDEAWDDEDDDSFAEEGFSQFIPSWSPDYLMNTLTRAKLNVLERQERPDDYLAMCAQTGEHLRYALKLCDLDRVPEAVSYGLKRLTTAGEALALAQRLRESDHLDEAIKIGERGLKLAGPKAALGEWLGAIEEAQGRASQALEAWRASFSEAPSLATYQTIKRLAKSRWGKLKPQLTATLEKHYTKQPLAEVLLFEQQWDAATKIADKQTSDYRLVETVADAVIAHRPEWVVRASIKQAESLMVEPKSKYYPIAANWLRKTKAAYAQLGKAGEWEKYLERLKEQYRRRPALQAQLARL